MLRTVIVDDDFLVRSYLKGLDAWNRAGYTIIADVRDGEEALRLVEEEKPDVVITDISMPLMDGIELIRQIRKNDQRVSIVVLSCHDDFEYVKEAMKLGANEYVLKNSLDDNTLYDLLTNLKNQISIQQTETSQEEHTRKLIKMGSHSLKYHFFNRLLSGTMTESEREKKRKEAGICGRFVNSAVITMFLPSYNAMKEGLSILETEQYSQLFLSNVTEQVDRLLGSESDYVEIIYLGEGVFCCFLDLSSMHRSSLMKQRLTSVASACFRCCKEEPYDYAIGVSNICIGEDGIRQAYQQAREMLKMSFYDTSDILYFDSQKKIGRQMPESANELLEKITVYAAGKRTEETKAAFELVIQDCRKNCTDSKIVLHWIRQMDKKVQLERVPEDYSKIIRIDQLGDICEEYCRKLFWDKKKEIPQGTSNVIKQAVDYIHQHYKNQIGLGEVADAVGLNSAYFSYLFKQDMGIGFSNYLLDCRMECAKSLLLNTNDKIKDVASQSGFNDYHYFSKAFKKLTGSSPADYRKLKV